MEMQGPFKIIWKYKNNNKKVQYNQYIFVGSIDKSLKQIIESFKDYSLFETLSKLSKNDISILNEYYGSKWYISFFNSYHINFVFSQIKNNNIQSKQIIDKMGEQWFNENINKSKYIEKKLLYSYDSMIRQQYEKAQKKQRKMGLVLEDDEKNMDFKTLAKTRLSKIFNKQSGGDDEDITTTDEDTSIEDNDDDDQIEESDDIIKGEVDGEAVEESDEDGIEIKSEEEELDMAEIEELFKEDTNEKEISKTSELIKDALDDDKIFKRIDSNAVDFDTSKDDNLYDEELKDVYGKYYVYNNFIYSDDTIKVVKEKICSSLKNNSKFGDKTYLMPTRQYIWSEYIYDDNIEKIMLGQKWMRRNELLEIDIEPNNNFRIYEDLRNNLKLLRDNIKRYASKIRREEDDNLLLIDYQDYISNNDIFMIDVYNEIGKKYEASNEVIKNLMDVFLKIYFPKIRYDEFKNIIEYVNNGNKIETEKIQLIRDNINNDLVLENEIMNTVEKAKRDKRVYNKILKQFNQKEFVYYVTQSLVSLNLRFENNAKKKIDLFRLFNEFEPTEKYPFIQYQSPDGNMVFKYKESTINTYLKKKANKEIIQKWFENAPYGISIKVKILEKEDEDKFMAINLDENTKINFKTQWKEEDMSTVDDIKKSFSYVKELIEIINKTKLKTRIVIPEDDEFRFAFINTIQKFELPEKYVIDHNDLSDFSRYFFPYVALIVDPRKRKSKIDKDNETSKFGTYLRYKRVSKYENYNRIEQRIIYFMRNYEFAEENLIDELSKQFNITNERAKEEFDKVQQKYPNIKKARKVLKKLENLPKVKQPGIGIEIQGKQRENYKIRIAGARDEKQLEKVVFFMNLLIYFYTETYLLKNPEFKEIKEKLKTLTNIAKRRNKVESFAEYEKDTLSVKKTILADKQRLGFKPDKDQNQWSRCCQNSGKDKRRQPDSYNSKNIQDLIKAGYKFNKSTNQYERNVTIKKGSKKETVTLHALKVKSIDKDGNVTGDDIYYTCNPEENGEHFYVGFLTKCINPFGYCMPCCFKKDPAATKNKNKKEFFDKCKTQAEGNKEIKKIEQQTVGDKLYILQDTNKIQDGRIGYLPKYLDFFYNQLLNKDKKMKQYHMIKSERGYLFKQGVKQDVLPFLSAVGAALNMTIEEIKEKSIKAITEDNNEQIFTSLNNGDIKSQFITREKYIEFIKYSDYLDFEIINNLISIPGVLTKTGLNIMLYNKRVELIKKSLEKTKIREDFYLLCQNPEDPYSITDKTKETIFIIKEGRFYYPMVMVYKINETDKNLEEIFRFKYDEKEDNIIHHSLDFYRKNCHSSFLDEMIFKDMALSARDTYLILKELKKEEYLPKYQIIDPRNKCKYIITQNNSIIPVRSSGSLPNLMIIKNIDKYFLNFKDTFKRLIEIYNLTKGKLPIKPIGVYYDEKTDGKIKVNAITTRYHDFIPVIIEDISVKEIESMGLVLENKPLYDKIDKEIAKGKSNILIDNRILDVNYQNYFEESYNLFRFELSNFLNKQENANIRQKLMNIIENKKFTRFMKLNKIKIILFRLTDKELYKNFSQKLKDLEVEDETTKIIENELENIEINEEEVIDNTESENVNIIDKQTLDTETDSEEIQTGGANRFIHVLNRIPDIKKYKVKNDREYCEEFKNKDTCNRNSHCYYSNNSCRLGLTREMLLKFVNRVGEELSRNDIKAFEIMRIGDYLVDDIVDYNYFKEKEGVKIAKSTSNTIRKTLSELFGKDSIPTIGKKKISKGEKVNLVELNTKYPIKELSDRYIQEIIPNNLSIFRAYVNAFYWNKNPLYDLYSRNLGFYSLLQTDLANYFKSLVMDWLQKSNNQKLVEEILGKYINKDDKQSIKKYLGDFIVNIGNNITDTTNCLIELLALSALQDYPILVINENDKPKFYFKEGRFKNSNIDNKNTKDTIILRFSYITNDKIPNDIEVVYNK